MSSDSAHVSNTAKNTVLAPSLFSLLKRYRALILWLVVLGMVANALTLLLPTLIGQVINTYTQSDFDITLIIKEFVAISFGVLVFTYIQSIIQTYTSELVAHDLRMQIVGKIARQNYRFIELKKSSKLLTNITSDVDSVKQFVATAIVSLVSSIVVIIGTTIILLIIDIRLALAVLTIIPVIGMTFFIILRLVRKLFIQSREAIDWLNKVINENITGATLIRVLNAQSFEYRKFTAANHQSRTIGIGILKLFSFMIPVVTFVSGMGTLIVITLGGYYVTNSTLSLGEFVAFNSYIAILIFPLMVIGSISTIIARARASYVRIRDVLVSPDVADGGTYTTTLQGDITVASIALIYGTKPVLKDISFTVKADSRTAIIGPTGGGKTQLLNVMTGLNTADSGTISYDGHSLTEYDKNKFYPQIGLVFQDSVLYNTTMRENIAFSTTVTDQALEKAIATAELTGFIASLPIGLDTVISERGTSLSGGQKQRIMLARALALDPKVLFLDDFTARVDISTEKKILSNIKTNYSHLTLVSITQKIASIEDYDQIILLMEGEVLAVGTHSELMCKSPEYVQIYNLQRSTNAYEL